MATLAEQLADFVVRVSFDDLAEDARTALKIRILDSLGCAIGALGGAPVRDVRMLVEEFGGAPRCSLIGSGKTAPDRAAFYNGALIRYLDFNDSYLAPGETCHPSDNLGAVLAAAEFAGGSGRELLTALAVAYQVQARLSDVAPVRDRGFDHTTHGAYAAAAGVARALRLDRRRTAHAVAIAGTAFNALRVTRTGRLSHWKGLAGPAAASGGALAAFLARQGVTGPLEVFEGNKGFMEAIAGPFDLDWEREGLDRVRRTIVKRYNAEVHSQSTLEATLELRARHAVRLDEVERIEVDTFDVAHRIIGGGEEGDKTVVGTKEQADHSLPYLVAVALLDGQVMPEQFRPERIVADDVQMLLRRVIVRPSAALGRRFPAEMPSRVRIMLQDGRTLAAEKTDYEGFHTRPAAWEPVAAKFRRLSAPHAEAALQQDIIQAVADLERVPAAALAALLARVGGGTA